MTHAFHPQQWIRRPVIRRLAAVSGALAVAFGGPTAHVLSSALAAPLWTLAGTVRLPNGNAVSNAWVGLSVAPGALPKTPTPTTYLVQVKTGTDGSFSIPAPSLSPAALAQAASNDGWLNMELDASAVNPDAAVAGANGDATYLGGDAISVLVAPSLIAAPTIGTVRGFPDNGEILLYGLAGYGTNAAQPTVSNLEHKIPCLTTNCFAQPASATSINSQCGQDWYAIQNNNYMEPVGEFHTWDDMSGEYSYGKTASTNLGVAFDYNSGNGWGLGGSAYMGQTSSYKGGSGPIGARYGYQQMNEFAWEEDESDSGCQGRSIYRIRPLWWTGGNGQGPDVSGGDGPNNYWSVPSQYRADVRSGSPVDIESGTGYTYTWQVNAFGVSLNSETDYSTQVTMHWSMGTNSVQHSLFGYGAPPSDPNVQLVFASTE